MLLLAVSLASGAPALPNQRQLEFMELEISQFMHFGVDTAWKPTDSFLRDTPTPPGPTYHNCVGWSTGTSHDSQTEGTYPCLNASIFNPSELDTDKWMEASASLGVKEICLTAKHAGGFTLWPTQHTPYGVHSAGGWEGGHGDVLKRFVASAKAWGIAICYYLNPMTDGYLVQIGNVSKDEYIAAEHGMLREILSPGSPWGPVNRFWFDGILGGSGTQYFQPEGLRTYDEYHSYYDDTLALIRELSPDTLVSAQRGDICDSTGSLYTSDGPMPNGTDSDMCNLWEPTEDGKFFHPNEMHGVTMQEGPDGNEPVAPTYWFWHPRRVCAENATSCSWVGHANASRVFDGYIAVVGHGGNLNINIAPMANGLINASVVEVMAEAGKALNDTFVLNNAGRVVDVPAARCEVGAVVLDLGDDVLGGADASATGGGAATAGSASVVGAVAAQFDYIVTMEDLTKGQRIANYSVDFQLKGSEVWLPLVPVLIPNTTASDSAAARSSGQQLTDRPDGHDPRDQYVGRKRIDVPMRAGMLLGLQVGKVRLNCHRLIASVEPGDEFIHIRQFSLHKKIVPWAAQ